MEDLLGFARFERHVEWRCSGRVSGEVDDIEPGSFSVGRSDDRWVLRGARERLLVVGDARRDLVSADGGLMRCPPGRGFAPYLSGNLLHQIGSFSRDFVGGGEVVGSVPARRAGMAAVDVRLRSDGDDLTVSVDAETGLWTAVATAGFTIEVDDVHVGPDPSVTSAAGLLDIVDDVDLSDLQPVAAALARVGEALQEASGRRVQALEQDEETGEFRMVVLGADGEPEALVTRDHAGSAPRPPVLAGVQHRWETEEWTYHVDTVDTDPMGSRAVVKAVEAL